MLRFQCWTAAANRSEVQPLSPTPTSVMELRPMDKEHPRLHCCGTMIKNIVIYVL